MKEYLILVSQLEHLQRQGLLSLQKLWFYIQPTMRTMELLASIGTSFGFIFFLHSETALKDKRENVVDEVTLRFIHQVSTFFFPQHPQLIKESVWVGQL